MTELTATPRFTIKGWHVLLGFIAFFGIVIAVAVAFAMAAYRTFSGEAIPDPYEAGILYNKTLAQPPTPPTPVHPQKPAWDHPVGGRRWSGRLRSGRSVTSSSCASQTGRARPWRACRSPAFWCGPRR